jgi:ATP-dependent helicase HrpA
VALRIIDDPGKARRLHETGLTRLFLLRLGEQVKYLRKRLLTLRDLTLLYTTLPPAWSGTQAKSTEPVNAEEILDELMASTIYEVFLQDQAPVRNREHFEQRLEQHRSVFVASVERRGTQALEVLRLHQALSKRLNVANSGVPVATLSDIREQLRHMIYRGFIRRTEAAWWPRLPKYLQAIGLRLDRAAKEPTRDLARLTQITPLWQQALTRLRSAAELGKDNDELQRYRWLLEEYRLSLFAQEVKTVQPISDTRLAKLWQALKD